MVSTRAQGKPCLPSSRFPSATWNLGLPLQKFWEDGYWWALQLPHLNTNLLLRAANTPHALLSMGDVTASSALPLHPSVLSQCPMVTESPLWRSRHPLTEASHIITNLQPLWNPPLFEHSAALLSSSSALILSDIHPECPWIPPIFQYLLSSSLHLKF